MAEFNPSDLIETGSNAIPNGQVASVMRRSMENRNLLSEKGALYAGTGEPYTTQDSVGNTYDTAITDAVVAPTRSGQVLVSNLDSGGPDTGLEWQDAAPNAINATNATKLTSGTVGSSTTPVYFNNGQPAVCGSNLLVNITGNAATATNVTAGINGKAISSIFERDGVTARNATNARNATYDGEGHNIVNTYATIAMTDALSERLDELGFSTGSITGNISATLSRYGKYAILIINSTLYSPDAPSRNVQFAGTMSFTAKQDVYAMCDAIKEDSSGGPRISTTAHIIIQGNQVRIFEPVISYGIFGAGLPVAQNQNIQIGFEIE